MLSSTIYWERIHDFVVSTSSYIKMVKDMRQSNNISITKTENSTEYLMQLYRQEWKGTHQKFISNLIFISKNDVS